MRYPDALRGIRSLRTAEILTVWCLALSTLTTMLDLSGKNDAAFLPVLLLGIALIVLSIVALVKELIGVCQAARDISDFSYARTAIIAAIVLSFLSGLMGRTDVRTNFFDLASAACSLYAVVLILKGIITLSGLLRRPDMAERGKKLVRSVLIVEGLVLALMLLDFLLPEKYADHPLAWISAILILILDFVRIFLLLRYYKRAIDMMNYYNPDPGDGLNAPASSPETPWDVYP